MKLRGLLQCTQWSGLVCGWLLQKFQARTGRCWHIGYLLIFFRFAKSYLKINCCNNSSTVPSLWLLLINWWKLCICLEHTLPPESVNEGTTHYGRQPVTHTRPSIHPEYVVLWLLLTCWWMYLEHSVQAIISFISFISYRLNGVGFVHTFSMFLERHQNDMIVVVTSLAGHSWI